MGCGWGVASRGCPACSGWGCRVTSCACLGGEAPMRQGAEVGSSYSSFKENEAAGNEAARPTPTVPVQMMGARAAAAVAAHDAAQLVLQQQQEQQHQEQHQSPRGSQRASLTGGWAWCGPAACMKSEVHPCSHACIGLSVCVRGQVSLEGGAVSSTVCTAWP